MASVVAALDAAIRAAGVPIQGVAIGNLGDRSTWRVSPRELQAKAQPVIDAFVVPTLAELADVEARSRIEERALLSGMRAVYEAIPNPTRTWAQVKARALELYRT